MMLCTWYYCGLLCHVFLLSLGGLLFSVGRLGEVGPGKRERLGERPEGEEARETVIGIYCMGEE